MTNHNSCSVADILGRCRDDFVPTACYVQNSKAVRVSLMDTPTFSVRIDDSLTVLRCADSEELAGLILHDANSLLPQGQRPHRTVSLAALLETLVAKDPQKLWHLCSRNLMEVRDATVLLT